MSNRAKSPPGGRPTKLTPEIAERICSALRIGASIDIAAHHAGVHRDSIYRWLQRGEQEFKGAYAAFFEQTQRARADCQISALAIIKKASLAGDVKAAMFLLERRFPGDFGPRNHHQIEARVDQKVSVEDARAELESVLSRFASPDSPKRDPGEPESGGGGAAPA